MVGLLLGKPMNRGPCCGAARSAFKWRRCDTAFRGRTTQPGTRLIYTLWPGFRILT